VFCVIVLNEKKRGPKKMDETFETYMKRFKKIIGYRKDGAVVNYELTTEELKSLWYAALAKGITSSKS